MDIPQDLRDLIEPFYTIVEPETPYVFEGSLLLLIIREYALDIQVDPKAQTLTIHGWHYTKELEPNAPMNEGRMMKYISRVKTALWRLDLFARCWVDMPLTWGQPTDPREWLKRKALAVVEHDELLLATNSRLHDRRRWFVPTNLG